MLMKRKDGSASRARLQGFAAGLASGVLEAVKGERSQQEIAWAAREWVERLAAEQPVVLAFEDIHWAEDALLDLPAVNALAGTEQASHAGIAPARAGQSQESLPALIAGTRIRDLALR